MSTIKLNKENINEYYKKINAIIGKYISFGVHPENIKNYFKKGGKQIKNLIERNSLSDVENIERVVLDVVEDTYNMHSESIKTFESFIYDVNKESIEKVLFDTKSHTILNDGMAEKAVADITKTSMGYLSPVEDANMVKKSRAIYNSLSDSTYYVYHANDFVKINQNLSSNIVSYLIVEANVEIPVVGLNIPIRVLDINTEKTADMVLDYITKDPNFNQTNIITNLVESETGKEVKLLGKTNSGYYVWEIK